MPKTEESANALPALPSRVRPIDAEALAFFLALCETGTLQQAADRMAVSLSSANRILAKLRRAWNDPLFVRTGFVMKPTAGAAFRVSRVRSVLHTLEVLQGVSEVRPETLRRTVRLAAYDNAFAVGIAAILPGLSERLPGVRFQAAQALEDMFDELRADRLDLLFFARQGLPPDMHSTPFLTTPYACVVRKGHPLEETARRKGALDREDLHRWRQVLVNAQPDRYRAPNSPGNGWFNPPSPELIAVVMPFFLAVPLCLEGTDFYAVVPMLTAKLAFDEKRFSFLPFSEGTPVLTTQLGWHDRTHADPGMQIIRSVLKELAQKRARELLSA